MTISPANQPTAWQRSTTRRLFKWIFSWRTARWFVIGVVGLVTLWALLCTEENIRGRRTWERYRKKLEARGEQLDFKAFLPKPVPDDENFAATPVIRSWFPRMKPNAWNDNYARAESKLKINAGRRQFMDLVAWAEALGSTNARATVNAGSLDLASRVRAAPAVLEALRTNEAMLAELQDASRRPYSRYPVDYDVENPYAILLPHLSSLRQVCRRLELKACAELAIDQDERAGEDVNLTLRVDDSLKDEPFLISYLVRVACLQAAVQPVWEGLAEHHWTDEQLQQLQARLQRYDFVADLKPCFEVERAAGIVAAEVIRKRGLGYLVDIAGPGQPTQCDRSIANGLGMLVPSGWLYLEQYNVCRAYQALMDGTMDPSQRRVFPDRSEANIQAFDREIHSSNFATVFLHHQVLAALLLPALNRVITKAAVAQTVADEAMLGCALERYRLENGRFPETLDTLVPQFVSQLPHDVITGEPYKYRRTDDDRFVLYSVGWNDKDDGGVSGKTVFDDKAGDWVWEYPTGR